MIHSIFDGTRKVTFDEARNPLFWIDTIRDLVVAAIGYVPRVILAGAFLALFYLGYRFVRRLAIASMKSAHVDDAIREMIVRVIKWTILGGGIVAAANQLGIQITALLAGASVAGLAVSLAAKETLANVIAGIVIFWDKPFHAGDIIEIAGVIGQVQAITFRSTRLLTGAGEVVVFPNTTMLATKLSNHSTSAVIRVRVDVTISCRDSIDDARDVLLGTLADDARVAADPAPSVVVTECSGGRAKLALYFWVADKTLEGVLRLEYVERAKIALIGAGIPIPVPCVQAIIERPSAGSGDASIAVAA